jgi:Holliday junction resolvase RusA-like endonuclease
MTELTFTIPGMPRGKERPRFWNGRAVTPQKTRDYEELMGWAAKQAGAEETTRPCRVEITATFPVPFSWPKNKKANPGHATCKPDADNILKVCLDACNGIVFKDDKQVWDAHVTKVYGDVPGIALHVTY